MMAAAIVTVTLYGVVMFTVGYACGTSRGSRLARIDAFNKCIDWAALAMKGSPAWRSLTPDQVLTKAACLIGGSDAVDDVARAYQPRPQFTKGNQV